MDSAADHGRNRIVSEIGGGVATPVKFGDSRLEANPSVLSPVPLAAGALIRTVILLLAPGAASNSTGVVKTPGFGLLFAAPAKSRNHSFNVVFGVAFRVILKRNSPEKGDSDAEYCTLNP